MAKANDAPVVAANVPHAAGRRKLRFETFDDVLREAEALATAESAGTLSTSGHWTLGQALGHLASWASYPLDGYPKMRTPPWILRKLAPLLKRRVLNKKMPAGMRIPGVLGGTFGIDLVETDKALSRLHAALVRLQTQEPAIPHAIFGPLTHQEWINLNLRHAELHLGFFQPS